MPKVVIQVAKCQPASIDAQGRKFGAKIFDTQGNKYSPGPKLFGMFQDGHWYEVFYEDSSFQGNAYKQIMTANPTTAVTPANRPAAAPERSPQQHEKDMQIWCNSMMQRAIDSGKLDPWNEDASVELCVVQQRVFRRVFLGEEAQEQSETNSGQSPQARAHPGNARDMDDEIPF